MDDDQRSPEETEQRLQKLLEGAFSGPPKPLKAIPKRNGESRAAARRSPAPAKKKRPKARRKAS
jgi:hypothetical protein